MDAVMVVHQLQRLATASPPSASLTAKLPRVAVGICYFIDHPEVGVRQQAAAAVKAVALKHYEVLRLTCCGNFTGLNHSPDGLPSSIEDETTRRDASHSSSSSSDSSTGNVSSSGLEQGTTEDHHHTTANKDKSFSPKTEKNLITLLQRHVNSDDAIVRDCCRAALQALLPQQSRQPPVEHQAAATQTYVGAAQSAAATAESEIAESATADDKDVNTSGVRVVAAAAATAEAGVGVAASCDSRPAAAESVSSPSRNGLREEGPQRKQQNSSVVAGRATSGNASLIEAGDSLASATTHDAAASRPAASTSRYSPLEGELCTVLLGLRGLLRQYERLQQQQEADPFAIASGTVVSGVPSGGHSLSLEKLRRDLQYRLVRVSGVSSVTITLNTRYLEQQLLLEEKQKQEEKSLQGAPHQCISSSCSLSPSRSTSRSERRVPLQQQQEGEEEDKKKKKREDEREEGDGVAVLLMRLPSPPKKRLRALQAVKEVCGPLTLVLRATRVYEHRRATTRSRHSSSSSCAAAAGRAGAAEGPPAAVLRKQQHQEALGLTEEAEEDDAEGKTLSHERDAEIASSMSAAPAAANLQYLDDEQQSGRTVAGDSRSFAREEQENDLGFQYEKSGTPLEEIHASGDLREEGFCGWGPTAAGFSFFSRNSALFSQSRHLSSCLLPYEEDERQIAERLKREKRLKQQAQRQEAKRETVVDRVLSNIGKGVFW